MISKELNKELYEVKFSLTVLKSEENEENDPMISKELNKESYEMKISLMALKSDNKGDLSIKFSTIIPKKPNFEYSCQSMINL